jgi:adenylosuccinate lyase
VLLFLTQNNVSREDAYKIVQRNAMLVWKSFGIDPDNPDSTPELSAVEAGAVDHDNRLFYFLSHDEELKKALSVDDLQNLLNESSIDYHTKRVDVIFKRVFGES